MKIRTKLIFNYSALSFLLLLVFSCIVVLFYVRYRQNDFRIRLQNRAITSVNMLFNEQSIDSTMLRQIDKNIITSMSNFTLAVYTPNGHLHYTNTTAKNVPQLHKTKNINEGSFSKYVIWGERSIQYSFWHGNKKYDIVASAHDTKGVEELQNLIHILLWVLASSLVLIVGFGFYNAQWSLHPFRKLIAEVDSIEPSQLNRRLSTAGADEVSQLSHTFNILLDRIAQSVETEKAFIANASHELRTPVTSVLGQIEVALHKSRSADEYRAVLQSVYDDTAQMATIINGFLNLTEANQGYKHIDMSCVAIDDLLFSIIEDFEQRKPSYNVSFEFITNPETDKQIQSWGNERLLYLMFANIIDNACKYSNDQRAKLKVDCQKEKIQVQVCDYGIGIAAQDLEHIFKPLFRGSNITQQRGHGIGLAIVKRIADLHNATIEIQSQQNIGTTVSVTLKALVE